MKSYGFKIHFASEDLVEEYARLHESVWPEVKDAFRSIGLRTMQLFHMPPLELFMYIEATEDFVPERDFREYVSLHPKVAEWDSTFCSRFLERIPSNRGVTDWAPMRKIYAYDRREHRVDF